MDFIDPKKQRQHNIRLVVGYVLIAVAILLTTIVLISLARGYGFDKNGKVIQNGFVFVSSRPASAQIYLNNELNKAKTNSRLELPAGQYTLELNRAGYRPWVRSLGVEGGSVEHFDYPFLFPTILATTTVQQYASRPGLVMQSPDRRWLLIQQPGSSSKFYEYDLNNQKQLASSLTTVGLPAGLLTPGTGAQSWQLVEWSNDNRHVLLQHIYHGGSEYIVLDRQTPADSINLTKTLNLNATTRVTLDNKKYNQYYLQDTAKKTLSKASLTSPKPVAVLDQVLAFKSYGSNTLLYATSKNAQSHTVNIDMLQGTTNYAIQTLPSSTQYLLNLTQYSGSWYVADGTTSGGKIYVYKNPMAERQSSIDLPLVPAYILKVNHPNYLEFSSNAQFVAVEGGSSFAVYDAENAKGYAYNLDLPIAAGQHATWMDGDRLTLSISNHTVVFDYDGANQQTLQTAVNGTVPYFDRNYKWLYALAPVSSKPAASQKAQPAKFQLTSTALLIPADQ